MAVFFFTIQFGSQPHRTHKLANHKAENGSHRVFSIYSGLLIGRGKKVKFCGIFRDKIAEKSADFAGIFGTNLAGKQSVKKRRILCFFQGKFR